MVRLEHLQKVMHPQFIWDDASSKIMQTSETYEGAKDLGRMIFVGLADMNGFDSQKVQEFLDMSYDSYRNKIQQFRSNLREANRRAEQGIIFEIDDPIKKFYIKVRLCLNSIKSNYKQNAYRKLERWLDAE